MAIRRPILSPDSQQLLMLENPRKTKWTKAKMQSHFFTMFLNSAKEQIRSVKAQCKKSLDCKSPKLSYSGHRLQLDLLGLICLPHGFGMYMVIIKAGNAWMQQSKYLSTNLDQNKLSKICKGHTSDTVEQTSNAVILVRTISQFSWSRHVAQCLAHWHISRADVCWQFAPKCPPVVEGVPPTLLLQMGI